MWSSRAPLELREQGAGRLREVGRRLRQLACEQPRPRTRGRASGLRPSPSRAAPRKRAAPSSPRGACWRWNPTLRRVPPVSPRLERARTAARRSPEDDVRLGADVAQRRREFLRLAGERLVDEHHRTLAGLDPRCADQVQAPAGVIGHRAASAASRTPTSRVPATPRRPLHASFFQSGTRPSGRRSPVAGGQRLGAVWRRHGDDHRSARRPRPRRCDGGSRRGQLVASGETSAAISSITASAMPA